MKISKDKLKIWIFGIIVISVVLIILLSGSKISDKTGKTVGVSTIDSTGKQILEITAKGGYNPKIINAKAGVDSILKILTKNTYDCSGSINIPALNFSKILPATGTTEVAISSQKAGSIIIGSCSMGMYGFKILFN